MNIVFYDLETGGTDPDKDEIIQVAAVAFKIDGDSWQRTADLERKLIFDVGAADPQALLVNSYNEEVWAKEAVTQLKGLTDFDDFARPYKDVVRTSKRTGKTFTCLRTGGHNILKFDDAFVRNWYFRNKRFCPFDYQEVFDTLQLAKWQIRFGTEKDPADYTLGQLCDFYKVPLQDSHDAFNDVLATARLAWRMVKKEKA